VIRWLAPLLVLLAAPVGATLAARHDSGRAVERTERAPGLRGEALPRGLAGSRAPAIALADARGGRSGTAAMAGRPYLVTFLYTHCPDECPATAAAIAVALRDLGRRAGDVGVLAVSVDPRGDSASAARAFLRRHGLPGTAHYLVGSASELRPVWRDWLVAGRDAHAPVTHSLTTWLVDARGRLRAVYAGDVPSAADLTHDLAALLAERCCGS
jgi:protein SCO1/2